MKLLGYARVSTDDQARGGHSLAQQPERLAAYCVAHGHELVGVIAEADGVSASVALDKRPGGADLLRRLKAGEADGVVVVRIDRLFRDLFDGVGFFREIIRKGVVSVHSLAEHIDTSSAAGRLALNIQLVLADHERDKTCERTQQVMDGMRKRGQVFGHVPYGLVAIEGQLFRVPAPWNIREQIVQNVRDGLSLATVRGLLFDRRIPSPNGAVRWAKSTIKGLVDTHAGLSHLPLLAADATSAPLAAPEAMQSKGATRAATRVH